MKKILLGFVLGIISMLGIGVVAYNMKASEIGYSPKDSSWKVDNVQDAINDLYEGNGSNNNYACEVIKNFSWTYSYKNEGQKFVVPCTGTYKIEVWGSQAGQERYDYLRVGGAYAKGEIELKAGKELYAYVGNYNLTINQRGFNGGGMSTYRHSDSNNGVGGGATDIRLKNGDWDDESSLASRIIVAAGAGGGVEPVSGYGYAGSLTATNVPGLSTASQTSGYAFGKGQDSSRSSGGGGYYGGYSNGQSASGGSSYISGHTGCVAITSETNLEPRKDSNGNPCEDGTTDTVCSIHYSKLKFTNTQMIAGNGTMPTHDGKSTMTGNRSTGYAKITYIG